MHQITEAIRLVVKVRQDVEQFYMSPDEFNPETHFADTLDTLKVLFNLLDPKEEIK